MRLPTRPIKEGTNPGFTLESQNYLDRYDNPQLAPKPCIIASFEEEDEEEEVKIDYCCAECD